MTGADAQRGDIVRNLTTGRIGTVIGSTQSGRLIVEPIRSAPTKWERWDTEIVHVERAS